MPFLILALAAATMTSCVTTHHQDVQTFSNGKLQVSCGHDSSLSHEHYEMVSCTFENTSDAWIEVGVAKLEPIPGDPSFAISTPADVSSYLTAFRFERAQSDQNTGLLLAGLAVVGAAAGAVSRDAALPGAALAVGASATSIGRSVHRSYSQAQYAYGDQHILGGTFRIPARMYVRKSALIENKKAKPFAGTIKLCLSSGPSECRELPIETSKRF